jgi:hypothetical protein
MTDNGLAPIHDRRDEEPIRRWEDRCDFIASTGAIAPDLICDRPRGHAGMHTGRLVWVRRVVGYGRLR